MPTPNRLVLNLVTKYKWFIVLNINSSNYLFSIGGGFVNLCVFSVILCVIAVSQINKKKPQRDIEEYCRYKTFKLPISHRGFFYPFRRICLAEFKFLSKFDGFLKTGNKDKYEQIY